MLAAVWTYAARLQWGRGFAATEGKRPLECRSQPSKLQWGRGFAATEGMQSPSPTSEATVLQWGRGFAATEGLLEVIDSRSIIRLQWGRGFAATEGFSIVYFAIFLISASMGPWLRSHGRAVIESRAAKTHRRFNGAVASQPRKASED